MSAFEEYSKMFSSGIIAKAKELNYAPDNICILEGDIARLRSEFPETYQNLISCEHNRDQRTPIQYGQDLVASWIFEDTLIRKLSDGGLPSSLAGADQNRKVLANANVSASSDASISDGRNMRLLEIMCDYKGWWRQKGHMELRDSKYLKLKSEKSLFLGVCTISLSYVLLDFSLPIKATYIDQYRPYGNKPAYSIEVPPVAMKRFILPSLISELKAALR